MEIRSRRMRENTSPDRGKPVCMQQQGKKSKPIVRVHVVYYLSRNGHLEHPHFMEVTHLANQPLRLKDVVDRLTVLRGRAMPSLYSWSCKRSYKTGFIWNDLSESDVIYPAEGGEYVLKGSELFEGASSERFQQVHQNGSTSLNPKRKTLIAPTPSPNREQQQQQLESEQECEEYDEEDYYGYEDGDKTSSTTPHSRCSRGVSTDDLEKSHDDITDQKKTTTQLLPPPSSRPPPPSYKPSTAMKTEFPTSRGSVLLQLIACGGAGSVAKAKHSPMASYSAKRHVVSGVSLQRGVVCRRAVKMVEEEDVINYMSENPRFGNPQSEEKEYFSGSIVESMSVNRVDHAAEPVLKKSNSYNEERSGKGGLAGEEREGEKREKEGGVRGKCIPRMRSSCATSSKQGRN